MYADQHNRLGVEHYKKGDYQGAIEEFNKALKINSTFVEAMVNLGVSYSDKGFAQDAIKNFRKAEALDAGFVAKHGLKVGAGRYQPISVATAELGRDLLRAGKRAKGLEELKKSVDLSPNYPDLRVKYGEALLVVNDYEEAQYQVKKAIEINPQYDKAKELLSRIHYARGMSLFGQGMDHEAMMEFRRSVVADPKNSPIRFFVDISMKKMELKAVCEACSKRLGIGWKYCPHCGVTRT